MLRDDTPYGAVRCPLPARFVAVGLGALIAAVLAGAAFTLVFSGHGSRITARSRFSSMECRHAALGLGGWLTLTAIGVSYRCCRCHACGRMTREP